MDAIGKETSLFLLELLRRKINVEIEEKRDNFKKVTELKKKLKQIMDLHKEIQDKSKEFTTKKLAELMPEFELYQVKVYN